MDFSTLRFSDVFAEVSTGFPPGIYTTTSSVGSAILMGAGARKAIFHLSCGSNSGAASAVLAIYAASVSTGVGSTLVGSSLPVFSCSASPTTVSVELRAEKLETMSVGPYVFPVFSPSGTSSWAMAITARTFLRSYAPASAYNTAGSNLFAGEVDLY